jgi:enoyl-CoA hydratase/carnithine racemase
VIHYEKQGRTVLITLEGDSELNLGVVSDELHARLQEYRDDDELWCAVVTGAGQKAFSAGANLKNLAARGFGSFWTAREMNVLSGAELWKPLIAAINGYALGAGMMFSLACDVRICGDTAQFGLPEVKYGFPPGMGAALRLPRLMPLGPALEMLLTGDRISAQDALRWGLVNKVVPPDQVVPEALALAERITAAPPLAVRATKELTIRGLDLTFEQGQRLQETLSNICRQTEDAKEGPRAFAEKRKPEFKGR